MAIASSRPVAPLVIAHRGASALRPEHTLAAYAKAIEDGADVIEPDLVCTRDGALVARHENDLSDTTDVAFRPEFASRKRIQPIDGKTVEGWFTEDFTLAELKMLRARERIPACRPGNVRYNDLYEIPTLDEVIDLAQRMSAGSGRAIGIYPETKHPSHFRAAGLAMERRLVDTLHARGYAGKQAPVFIQSFEVSNLKEMRSLTELRLVQLLAASGQPEDLRSSGDRRAYRDMSGAAGLREIASYADAIGPAKEMVIEWTAGREPARTPLAEDAHRAGLLVHAYTFRPENPFLPPALRRGDRGSPSARGDLEAELHAYLDAGVDGIFIDDPAVGRSVVDARALGLLGQ